MKQAQNARKQRGRPAQRKGGRSNNNNGNRFDNRSRGNPKQLLEKYKTQARDSLQAGDRVNAEYFLQFADHYQRLVNEQQNNQGNNNQNNQAGVQGGDDKGGRQNRRERGQRNQQNDTGSEGHIAAHDKTATESNTEAGNQSDGGEVSTELPVEAAQPDAAVDIDKGDAEQQAAPPQRRRRAAKPKTEAVAAELTENQDKAASAGDKPA